MLLSGMNQCMKDNLHIVTLKRRLDAFCVFDLMDFCRVEEVLQMGSEVCINRSQYNRLPEWQPWIGPCITLSAVVFEFKPLILRSS